MKGYLKKEAHFKITSRIYEEKFLIYILKKFEKIV